MAAIEIRLTVRHATAAVLLFGLAAASSCTKSDDNDPFASVSGSGGTGAEGGDAPEGGGPLGGDGGADVGSGGATGGFRPTGGAAGGPGDPCEPPEQWCNTGTFVGCAELGTPEHCAYCGDTCGAGESCVDAADGSKECSCVSGTRCPTGTGDCVDTMTDENHCGGCDITCGTNAQCSEGSCGCTDAEFPDPHENADTGLVDCYDFSSDVEHCGDFGTQCLPGEECVSGVCDCTSPKVYCPSEDAPEVCVDLDRDVDNCSACGVRCPENGVCQSGECQCQPDAPTVCYPSVSAFLIPGGGGASNGWAGASNGGAGVGNGGAAVSDGGAAVSDGGVGGANFGGLGAGGEGTAGADSGSGGAPPSDDPGICADTETHPRACGDSCTDCFVAVGVDAVCTAGVCECPTGTDVCINPDTGDDTCVDKQTDEGHCGACGNACDLDKEECWGGECVDSPCGGLCDSAMAIDPAGTTKGVGCYELTADQIPNASTPRIVGWSFSSDFALEVNGEAWDTFTNGADHPLGETRLGGWCIEVTAGSAAIYAPND